MASRDNIRACTHTQMKFTINGFDLKKMSTPCRTGGPGYGAESSRKRGNKDDRSYKTGDGEIDKDAETSRCRTGDGGTGKDIERSKKRVKVEGSVTRIETEGNNTARCDQTMWLDKRRLCESRTRLRDNDYRCRKRDREWDRDSDRHRSDTDYIERERVRRASSRASCKKSEDEKTKKNQSAKDSSGQKETSEKAPVEHARKYQLEVLEQAKLKNTIAFLETGAGKTLIAVLLMKSKHEALCPQKRKMLAVFLVPKVPLVYQQAEVIRECTGFRVGHYCGEMGQDFWDARRWQREFENKEVLVMTAQILLNILRHSILRMPMVDLLILDECHHAVKKHPYSLVMSEFYHLTPKEKRPAVFGMTASPVNLKGVSSQEDCAIKIRNLESKLDSTVCTIRDRKELEKHVPTPLETVVEYDKAAVLWSLREQIKQMESAVEDAASSSSKRSKWQFMGARDAGLTEELRLVYGVSERTESDGAANLLQKLRAVTYTLDELGQWCAYKVAQSFLSNLKNDERVGHQVDVKFQESYLQKVVDILECHLKEGPVDCINQEKPLPGSAEVEEGELPDTRVVSGGEHVDQILGEAVADGKVTPKVQSLIKILMRYRYTDDFRAIIFVERVVAATVLPKILAELPSLQFVQCASLIGHNNNQDMRTRQMQETISKFRDGRVTLLVATSVAEEGLDIRQCNVVIRFDLAKTVLAYIQSRGRARKPGSDYILMLEKGNNAHQAFLRNARNSEETLRREAVERTELSIAKEIEILSSVEAAEGDVYQVPSTGAMVSLNSAVGLVHLYCSQLPSDRYSILKPEFIIHKHEKDGSATYSCKLRLPCNAPIETVEGPICTSIRGAQQAVCLDACKKLHELGAFTDMLLPDKGTNQDSEKIDDGVGDSLPGTARHREYYPEGVAEILKGDWILAGKKDQSDKSNILTLYIYAVQSRNVGFSNDPLLTQASDFALLFGRKLDEEILSMSMDLFIARTLTVKTSLAFKGCIKLTVPEVVLLKSFHVRLMSIVLDIDVDPSSTPWDQNKAYLFVPIAASLDSSMQIDWELINSILTTHAWKNPLQRPRPDVYLGTDERALGGDRREYGFAKLRSVMTFGVKHPTYGIRGAVAPFDIVKASGLVPERDHIEQSKYVPAPEGRLLMADGFSGVEGIIGRVVTAVHSGKRFYVESICPEMTAESSFPRKEGYLGPLEYSSYADYYKQKYGVDLVCKTQPLLRGRGVSHCKNLLSPRFEPLDENGASEIIDKAYYVMLPPELCLLHPLPGPLVRGAQRLPSVMRRVESMLLAIQLKHEINYPIAACKLLEALTAASCQETFCYERAELLGDAYLKWVVSRRLFLKFPTKHEGQLTRMRQQTVSNSVLYQYALDKSLQFYIQADRFAPSRWAAPGVPPVFDEETKNGDDPHETGNPVESTEVNDDLWAMEVEDDSHSLEDGEIEADASSYRVLSTKTLADVVEALIGTYYVEGGQKAAKHLMNWIGIPIDFDLKDVDQARKGYSVPEVVMRSIEFKKLEDAIGYQFQAQSLLVEAITHASRPSSGIPCYQRLEFIGDAVLDYLITRHLFFSYQDLPPGRLTDLRAAAVNNENFARVSVKHTFHLHLRHGSSALETQIHDFVNDIQSELDKPGVNSFGIGDFKAPKVLGDILESVAGAIFIDAALNTDMVWKVFKPLLQPIVTPETLPMHPVRELQERCQQQAEGLEYKASRAGNLATVEVFVDGVQIGSAQNAQRKMAQKLAARNALVVLKLNDLSKEEDTKIKDAANGSKQGGKDAGPFTRQTLNDICLRSQWPMPQYRLLHESGPAHAKRFTYTVRVHTTEHGWTQEYEGQPMPSVKKAKDSAAVILLQLLKNEVT